MNIEEIIKVIYDTVCEIQDLSGRSLPDQCSDTMVPIGDVDGFDSLNGVEVATQISGKLECAIDGNPFVSGNKALTIKQIAQNIKKEIS